MRRPGLLLVLLSGLAAGPTLAGKDVVSSKRELDAVKARLHTLEQAHRETTRERGDAADALAESERAINESTRKLHELDAQQKEAFLSLRRIGKQRDQLESSVHNQQARLGESLRALYRRGDGDALKLLLNGQDPNQSARDLRNLSRLSQAQAVAVEHLRTDLGRLALLRDQAVAEARRLDRLKQAREGEQAELEADKRKRATLLAELSKTAGQQKRAIADLQRDEKALTALIDKLNRIAAERAKKSAKKAEPKKSESKRSVIGYNTRTPEDSDTTSAFSRLRGSLRLPVVGELMNRFGAPREGGGLDWKGLFIRATKGQPVKAIAAGEVVFAEWMRGFGNLIVVDHGEGYMSLYSNNESLYKRVGDPVRMGESIASVGNSGGQPDAGLYFEMRYESRPLNPMNWVK